MNAKMNIPLDDLANLAAASSSPEVADGAKHLMALSEALWERASREAGPEVTALFTAHIEVEALIHWLRDCQRCDWLSSEIAKGNVQRTISEALAAFGEDLDKALSPHLEEMRLLQE